MPDSNRAQGEAASTNAAPPHHVNVQLEQHRTTAEHAISEEVSEEEIVIPVNTHRVASARNHHETESIDQLKQID